MPDYDAVLAVLKWSGIVCLCIVLLYFTLKSRGKWKSFVWEVTSFYNYLISLILYLIGLKLSPGPSDEDFLEAQKCRESRLKKLRELEDFCPYCKFNLKSGKDTCDECGKMFYEPEGEM